MSDQSNEPVMRDAKDAHRDPDAVDEIASKRPGVGAEAPNDWRAAEALKKLRAQIDAAYPERSKKSDGTVGDAAHRSRSSDHNPWIVESGVGVVSATDITHHPVSGCDAEKIVAALHASRDPRIKYLIWNKRIANSSAMGTSAAWEWRAYGGSNPHSHHFHLSVKSEKTFYDDMSPWTIA